MAKRVARVRVEQAPAEGVQSGIERSNPWQQEEHGSKESNARPLDSLDPFFRSRRLPHPLKDILACHDVCPHQSDLSGDCVLAPVFGGLRGREGSSMIHGDARKIRKIK